MKRNLETIESVKNMLRNLQGKPIKMSVAKGRKKSLKFDAEIVALYPSVFMVQPKIAEMDAVQSCSYTEILCGNVKIC